MTREDLDGRYAEASWLIQKRTAIAGIKALTIGWESLATLTDRIAEIYQLSVEDKRKLKPIKTIDAADMVGKAATTAKAATGAKAAVDGIKIAKAAQRAASAGRLMKTAKMFVTAGPKAARLMANTGRVAASKGTPIGWIATGLYAIGTTGWLGLSARRYNLACYNLLADRYGLAEKAQPDQADPTGEAATA